MSDFERVLLRLYTDSHFRQAVRKNAIDLASQYNLSAQEISALNSLDLDALDAGETLHPDHYGTCRYS